MSEQDTPEAKTGVTIHALDCATWRAQSCTCGLDTAETIPACIDASGHCNCPRCCGCGADQRAAEAPPKADRDMAAYLANLPAPRPASAPREPIVWADEASPFTGAQVKALLDENERLRTGSPYREDMARIAAALGLHENVADIGHILGAIDEIRRQKDRDDALEQETDRADRAETEALYLRKQLDESRTGSATPWEAIGDACAGVEARATSHEDFDAGVREGARRCLRVINGLRINGPAETPCASEEQNDTCSNCTQGTYSLVDEGQWFNVLFHASELIQVATRELRDTVGSTRSSCEERGSK